MLEPYTHVHLALSAAGDLMQLGRRSEAEALVGKYRATTGEHPQRRVLWELAVWDGLIASLDGELTASCGGARALARALAG